MSYLRTVCAEGAKLINHGLQEFDTGRSTLKTGCLLIVGAYYVVKAGENIYEGKIREGVVKSAFSVFCLASAIYIGVTAWSPVLEDSKVCHCRKWIPNFPKELDTLVQKCNVFGCSVPARPCAEEIRECAMLAEPMGKHGFRDVYAMKQAETLHEAILVPTRSPEGEPSICTFYPKEQIFECKRINDQ